MATRNEADGFWHHNRRFEPAGMEHAWQFMCHLINMNLGEDAAKKGIRVKTSSFSRVHSNTLMSKSKAVGLYINSILAGHEAKAAGYDEALLLDTSGFAAEGPGENLFVVRDGEVLTPSAESILPGITRDTVIRILREGGYVVREERISRDSMAM